MKRKIELLLVLVLVTIGQLYAQDQITVNANSYDISDNLDLEAVAYLFGESKNLETFEMKLNDPELQISNLDLNNDGYVDYLRVIEVKKGGVFVITIQAVLGEDLYQDVATIDVEVKNKKTVYVQVVGNEYIYGTNYIFEPVYVHRPVIFDFFWHPRQVVWYSPYYWSYYPVYYSHRNPREVYVYHHYVYEHYHHKVHCRYVPKRKIHTAVVLHQTVHRNDYAKSQPNKSFTERHKGFENRHELDSRRSSSPNTQRSSNPSKAVEKTNTTIQPEKSVRVYRAPSQKTAPSRVETTTRNSSPSVSTNRQTPSASPRNIKSSESTSRKAPSSTRNSSPSVSTSRQTTSPSVRKEVKQSTPVKSEAKQSTPRRNEVRQSAPSPKAVSSSNVRTSAPQNKSVSSKTAAKPSQKRDSEPARSTSVKPSKSSKKADSTPARSSADKPSERSKSDNRR